MSIIPTKTRVKYFHKLCFYELINWVPSCRCSVTSTRVCVYVCVYMCVHVARCTHTAHLTKHIAHTESSVSPCQFASSSLYLSLRFCAHFRATANSLTAPVTVFGLCSEGKTITVVGKWQCPLNRLQGHVNISPC